jgi:chromosome segregation ATPase
VTVDELQAVVEAQRGLNDLLRTANAQQADRISAMRAELQTAQAETARLAVRIHECEDHKATLNQRVELLSRDVNAIIERDPTGPQPIRNDGDDA